jgi:hypothetical protein
MKVKPKLHELIAGGWRFSYSKKTHFIIAVDPEGDTFSVAEIYGSRRFDDADMGLSIANLLNSLSACKAEKKD